MNRIIEKKFDQKNYTDTIIIIPSSQTEYPENNVAKEEAFFSTSISRSVLFRDTSPRSARKVEWRTESPEAAWPTSSSRKYARRVVAIVKSGSAREKEGRGEREKKGWLSASVGSGVGQYNEWEERAWRWKNRERESERMGRASERERARTRQG